MTASTTAGAAGRRGAAAERLEAALGEEARRLDAALEAPCDLPGPGEPLALWELRASSRSDLPEAIELDGGCRVERLPASGIPSSWRYAVGAPARRLPRLWSPAAEALKGRSPLERLVIDCARDLAARAAATARILEERTGGRAIVRARVRARIWRRGTGPARSGLDMGVRIRLEGDPAIDWCGPLPEAAPWSDGARGEFRPPRTEGPALPPRAGASPRPLFRSYEGPAVLLPDAAGRFVHEMVHAAIESGEEGTTGGPARIVDDPPRAPWPAGFATDDCGSPAGAAVVWGSPGPRGRGRAVGRRRASIREPAVPWPSFSRLEGGRPETGLREPLALGLPVFPTASRGRFDTLAGEILLEVPAVYLPGPGGAARVEGPAVVTIRPEEAWVNVRVAGDEISPVPRMASCTRKGQVLAVMVGAPTIILDPVRILAPEGP
ncbi:MAG: hypothetical protein D6718_06165 [Acidobacteria bacterium]|nr:MAG: hypothetical protein D6718_06165 [Acidobacteriota bacterium]